MGFMAGKRALIVGVASDRSIATGIAEAFAREGAEIAFTYQNDKLKSRVIKLAERLGQSAERCYPCDVSSDEEIASVFNALNTQVSRNRSREKAFKFLTTYRATAWPRSQRRRYR
jgi:enoyl-[acyl-carrier protein] reductase I